MASRSTTDDGPPLAPAATCADGTRATPSLDALSPAGSASASASASASSPHTTATTTATAATTTNVTASATAPTILTGPALDRLPKDVLFHVLYPMLDLGSHFCLAAASRGSHGGMPTATTAAAATAAPHQHQAAAAAAGGGLGGIASTAPGSWHDKVGVALRVNGTPNHLQRLQAMSRVPGHVVRRVELSVVVTDAALTARLACIARMPGITEVRLRMCNVRDGHLALLGQLPNLQSLVLDGCTLICSTLASLGPRLPQLHTLKMVACMGLWHMDLTHFGALTQLQTLDLSHCDGVRDADLYALHQLPRLSTLNVYSCVNVTDMGLEYLHGMPQLQRLGVRNCRRITPAGKALLRYFLPHCVLK